MTARFFTCNLCEAQCGLRVEVDGARVAGIRGDPEDVLSRGHVCPKAHALRELLEDPARLRAPVRRTAGGWERASWDEALSDVTRRLRAVRARHGRDAVALYVGNPVAHSHGAALGSQLLTMALGTKNRFDPNSQDSNPRLFACMHVYGDALSIPVPDVDRTDHLLVLGANPAASNGSQMGLGDVRARMRAIGERGGRVVLVDPRRTESAAWATSHCFIRPGGDAALVLAMLHVLFAEGRVNETAVGEVAAGLGELRALARRFPPERVAPAVGIDAARIRALALDFAGARTACAYARVGVCQNAFGPVASWLVEALNVVTGNFDRAGGAMFPAAPADVAPLGRLLVGNRWGRWRSRVRGLPEMLGALPSAAMAEEMETPGEGRVRALVCVAGNPVLTTPNGERLARALADLELVVAVDYYVNETTRHAHWVLPARHVFETGNFDLLLSRFSVRNNAKYSPPIVRTGDDTRDDWDILSDLAARVALPRALHGACRAAGRGLPERVVDLLLRLGGRGLSLRALRDAPHGIDLGPLVPSRRDRVRTEDGRVRLAPPALVADVPRLEAWVDERRATGDLVLVGRRHLRSNNSWMNALPSLAKGPDRARLLVHPADAARIGFADGARVTVRSRTGRVEAVAHVSDEVMPGVVSLPHGFARCSANALTDERLVEPVIGTSILNGVPVVVEVADAS